MFDRLIAESFSSASYMDVRELRMLYYGRLDMYVSFTDDSSFVTKNNNAPEGIICHKVDTVVGRKANTSLFYGRVFRVKKSGGKFIENIKTHSTDSLKTDIAAIRTLSYLNSDDVESAVKYVMTNTRIRSAFERLWELSKILSDGNDKTWARILLDIGYSGFSDQSGLGIITKARAPVAILLDMKQKTDFDIVPLQKYRVDPRARIRNDVDRQVRLMGTKRKRVAKKDIGAFRGDKKQKKSLLSDLITTIGLM